MKEKHKSWSLKKKRRKEKKEKKKAVSTRFFAGLSCAYMEKSFEEKLME